MLDSSAYLLQYMSLPHSVGCYMKYIIINLMAFRTSDKNFSISVVRYNLYLCSAKAENGTPFNNNLKVNLALCF